MATTSVPSRRILVPLDGSSFAAAALPYARSLAGFDSEIILLYVAPPPAPLFGDRGEMRLTADAAWEVTRAAISERLMAIASDAGLDSLLVSVEVTSGDPAAAILAFAAERKVDQIVMTTHGRGYGGRLAFGSVADRVARAAEVPVLLIRPSEEPLAAPVIRRLVVPLDGSRLAARALPVAVDLAKRLKLPLLLVSAIDPAQAGSSIVGYGAALSDSVYRDVAASMKSDAERRLEGVGCRLVRDGIPTNWRIVVGAAAAAIGKELVTGDLVVMTSHGRGGIKRWLLGSVAEKLIRDGHAPVMLVRVEPAEARVVELAEADNAARTPALAGV